MLRNVSDRHNDYGKTLADDIVCHAILPWGFKANVRNRKVMCSTNSPGKSSTGETFIAARGLERKLLLVTIKRLGYELYLASDGRKESIVGTCPWHSLCSGTSWLKIEVLRCELLELQRFGSIRQPANRTVRMPQ